MKIDSYSLQGKRESNEDKHYYIMNINNSDTTLNPINLIGVFDGHGGKLVSTYLKKYLPPLFLRKFKTNIYLNPEKASKHFNKVYNLIQTKLIEEHPRAVQYCGSTACIGIEFRDTKNTTKLWIINLGDSRAIKCNKSNIAEQLSHDHKPDVPSEKKRIEKLGGEITFDGSDWRIKDLSLSRAFGDVDCTPYVTHMPQIYDYKINSHDKFMVFACDGLWDVLSNQDVVNYVLSLIIENYKGNYAKMLAELAYKKGSLDNITVIVYLF